MSYLRKIVLDQTTESMSGTHGVLYWRSIIKRMKRAVGRSSRVRRRLLDLELNRRRIEEEAILFVITRNMDLL